MVHLSVLSDNLEMMVETVKTSEVLLHQEWSSSDGHIFTVIHVKHQLESIVDEEEPICAHGFVDQVIVRRSYFEDFAESLLLEIDVEVFVDSDLLKVIPDLYITLILKHI